MNALFTPQKTTLLAVTAQTVTYLSPFVVGIHFAMRRIRGDFPWDEAIAIPIFLYGALVFPLNLLFLEQGLRQYRPGVSILAWNPGRFWQGIGWTVLSGFPLGLVTIGMILDGIHTRVYGTAAFFLLNLYLVLVLRASIVMSQAHAQPRTPLIGGPAVNSAFRAGRRRRADGRL